MASLNFMHRRFDNVIITSMPRGRILALHGHRRKRVAKKYQTAIVFQRAIFMKENRETMHAILRDIWPYTSPKAARRACRALCKHGIVARVERHFAVK